MLRSVSRAATSGRVEVGEQRERRGEVTGHVTAGTRAGSGERRMAAWTRSADFDAIVIGAGHNGLVCAAYLARGGLRTLLIEARDAVGGTAASEPFAGATVNICNCDHITFRTTPVMEELRPRRPRPALPRRRAVAGEHGVERRAGLAELPRRRAHARRPRAHPSRRGRRVPALPGGGDCRPCGWCSTRPTTRRRSRGLTRKVLRASAARGVSTLLRWSRRSAADVMRSSSATDALHGAGARHRPDGVGHLPGDARVRARRADLRDAPRRHGRPPGRRQRAWCREALRARVRRCRRRGAHAAPGSRRSPARASAVRGVTTRRRHRDHRAASSCRRATRTTRSCAWLTQPAAAGRARWSSGGGRSRTTRATSRRSTRSSTALPRPRALDDLGDDARRPMRPPPRSIAPSLAEMHRGHATDGAAARCSTSPALLVNVPTVLDPTMARRAAARRAPHVLSLEALYTPYALRGGWPGSAEPRRWLEQFATLVRAAASSTRSASGGR